MGAIVLHMYYMYMYIYIYVYICFVHNIEERLKTPNWRARNPGILLDDL